MISFSAKMTARQWMRAAKAFRCHLELPVDKILAAQLTALIERQGDVVLRGGEGDKVELKPAFIVDVAPKGKRFYLVIETVHETQNSIGPYLTGMSGEEVQVTITAVGTDPAVQAQEPANRGDIKQSLMVSLHSTWFKNEAFWRYLTCRTHINISEESTCKLVFKNFMRVKSCTELTQAAFDGMLADFNAHVAAKR